MQLLTEKQINQLDKTGEATYEAFLLVLDQTLLAITSDEAKKVYAMAYHVVMLAAAAAFYSGMLTRKLWSEVEVWSDNLVSDCLEVYPELNLYNQAEQEETWQPFTQLCDELDPFTQDEQVDTSEVNNESVNFSEWVSFSNLCSELDHEEEAAEQVIELPTAVEVPRLFTTPVKRKSRKGNAAS